MASWRSGSKGTPTGSMVIQLETSRRRAPAASTWPPALRPAPRHPRSQPLAAASSEAVAHRQQFLARISPARSLWACSTSRAARVRMFVQLGGGAQHLVACWMAGPAPVTAATSARSRVRELRWHQVSCRGSGATASCRRLAGARDQHPVPTSFLRKFNRVETRCSPSPTEVKCMESSAPMWGLSGGNSRPRRAISR